MRAFIKLVANTFFLSAAAGWVYLGYHHFNKYGADMLNDPAGALFGLLVLIAGFSSSLYMPSVIGEWLTPAPENNDMTIFDKIQAEKG